jgi:XTP/dITP diphosphohydrolase
MPDFQAAQKAFARLLTIMNELREGCPWDREQTFESLRILTIEETYELADAIDSKDFEELKKELGDLFLHLVFYAKMAEEEKAFEVADVLNTVCDKLIHRHPHIYGDVKADDTKAKGQSAASKSVLEGVPKALPSLVKAYRMQEKVAGLGFDWPKASDVWTKIEEELAELQAADNSADEMMEFGDVLFSLVNYARHRGIDPEAALAMSNNKFIERFKGMERRIADQSMDITAIELGQWEDLWQAVKAGER